MVYERESQIAINYAQLERRLKEVNSNLTEPTDISYSCACVINEVKGKQPQSHLEPKPQPCSRGLGSIICCADLTV